MARALTTEGRLLYPREHAAVAAFVLFGLALITAVTALWKLSRQRHFRQVPIFVSMLALACMRIAIASLEFAVPPRRRDRQTEAAMAILDAVTLVPLMWMLLAGIWCISTESLHKTPLAALEDWRAIALGVSSFIAAVLVITGSSLAFTIETPDTESSSRFNAGVGILRIGALLYVLILPSLAYYARCTIPAKQRKSVVFNIFFILFATGSPFLVVRLAWAVGSAFSIHHKDAMLNPFRKSNASTWANLGMAVVMEFCISVLCMFQGFYLVGGPREWLS